MTIASVGPPMQFEVLPYWEIHMGTRCIVQGRSSVIWAVGKFTEGAVEDPHRFGPVC